MKELDLKKLDLAIEYVQRMADGKHPVKNQLAETDSVINDANVVRCLYYVADVLKSVSEISKPSKNKKRPFPVEKLKKFQYRKDLTVSHLANQINENINSNDVKKVTYKTILKGLTLDGYVTRQFKQECQREITIPTLEGNKLGIYCERKVREDSSVYYSVVYNENAQYYIINNLERYMKM